MFDFTKEVVINSESQLVLDKNTATDNFFVHGGGKYFDGNVVENKAYKTNYVAGSVFELNLTPVAVASGDVQYHVQLGLDRGDARGDWGSVMYHFKKPLLVTVSKDADAAKIADAFNKVGASYGMIHANATGNAVVLTGGDDKIKVRDVKAYSIDGDNVKEVNVEYTYEPNCVEFGTYNYLLHNLRMPTYENYRYSSPAAVEMPVAGTNYIQYTFLYCVDRPGLGGVSVAGQTNRSTTTHVFYVAEALAGAFEDLLKKVVDEIVEVNPNGGSSSYSHNVDILPDANATVDMVDGE